LGNTISPQKIWDTLGADILRLWIASTDFRSEMVASDEIFKRVSDQYRRIRNTFRFLLGNINDFDLNKDSIELDNLLELDKWILRELALLQQDVKELYEAYSYHQVVQRIHNFCVNQLGGIYLDIIKDRQYTTQQDSEIRRSAQTAMQLIVNQLVVLISPVLSFTAEEIWQGNDFLLAEADSVFLTTLKELESFNSELSNTDWKRMLEIKEEVNQSIEESRVAGVIKGSLDASIELVLNSDDFNLANKFASEMHFFLIVSECNILQGESLKISVSKSSAEKCVRCWHRNKSVGSSKKHPELCNRCVENLDGPGEDRRFA
jgi:isoleucyl-tRNA synthetase